MGFEMHWPEKLRLLLEKYGLDATTLKLMFKGSLTPIIGLAIYQSSVVSNYFKTLGYLIPVISVLSLSMQARGKFIQTLIINVLILCFGCGMAMLALWSGLQARFHTQERVTTQSGTPPSPYNSSQSAVLAIWLFVNIWAANTFRAKNPTMNIPVIIYSILINVTMTFGSSFTSIQQAEFLVKEILTAMLTAMALATGVSLIIFPMSSRNVTMGQMKGMIALLRGATKLQQAYLQSLERDDMFAQSHDISTSVTNEAKHKFSAKKIQGQKTKTTKEKKDAKASVYMAEESRALKEAILKLKELSGKCRGDLLFAKRDIAWGYLDAKALKEVWEKLRAILIPLNGLGTIIDLFQRLAERRGWNTNEDTPVDVLVEKLEEKRVWNEVMRQLHEPFEVLSKAIDQGLEHADIVLGITPQLKESKVATETRDDIEAKGDLHKPGDAKYATVLAADLEFFNQNKNHILDVWAREKGLTQQSSIAESTATGVQNGRDTISSEDQSQLFILLYMETLMQSAGDAVKAFVDFADDKVADGTMSRKRLIHPGRRRLRKFFASLFSTDRKTMNKQQEDLVDRGDLACLGDGLRQKKDPEHLPPKNVWERSGNRLRRLSNFFSSQESIFGLRVAFASMTVGVVCFLEPTQVFFQQQRLVWAMIIIAISMTQTSGQSIFGFLCRVAGSAIAMVSCLVIWYIVDQHTPGIIFFLWLFFLLDLYFFLKYPRFIPAVMIIMVTQAMIIGYELQAEQIGIPAAQASGQAYYPIYELAPYRLATVAAGCLVAFFWTIFPMPVTDRTWLRRDLSGTLYLLAKYYNIINETLKSKMHTGSGDRETKGTPAYKLAKIRHQLHGELMLILPSLQQHAEWLNWELEIGGRFPRETYEEIILRSSRIASYLTLSSHNINFGPHSSPDPTDRAWISTMSSILADIGPTQHTIISTLILLSDSLQSGHSLPPYLPIPRPYELTRQIIQADPGMRGILDAKNLHQKGYAEFAVLQVCSVLICDDLEGLIHSVSKLVGIVDFSFKFQAEPADQADDDTASSGDESGRAGESGSTTNLSSGTSTGNLSQGSRLQRTETNGLRIIRTDTIRSRDAKNNRNQKKRHSVGAIG